MDQLKGGARSLVEENRMHMSRSLSIILKTCSGPLNLRCCGIVGMLLALQPCSSSILTNKILEAALTEKKKNPPRSIHWRALLLYRPSQTTSVHVEM